MSSDLKRPASPHPEQRPAKLANNTETDSSSKDVADAGETKPITAPTRTLLIKRLNENGRLPTRGSALSAGYDLYRCVTFIFVEFFDCL